MHTNFEMRIFCLFNLVPCFNKFIVWGSFMVLKTMILRFHWEWLRFHWECTWMSRLLVYFYICICIYEKNFMTFYGLAHFSWIWYPKIYLSVSMMNETLYSIIFYWRFAGVLRKQLFLVYFVCGHITDSTVHSEGIWVDSFSLHLDNRG